jgi:hypothetical protein
MLLASDAVFPAAFFVVHDVYPASVCCVLFYCARSRMNDAGTLEHDVLAEVGGRVSVCRNSVCPGHNQLIGRVTQ